jgi:outer membrane murein-binding lipoprotein Lpp
MKLNRIAAPLMAVVLMSGAPIFAHAQNSQNQSSTAVQDWNTPPAGTEQAQQGFRDGIEAAKLDKAAKRKIDAKSSHLYKNPPVKGAARQDYRDSFEKGYQAQLQHDNSGM